MPASGGVPRQVTQRDNAGKERGHGVPQFLPDGKRFLYFIASADPNTQGIYAGSLDDPKERVRILATDRKAYYAPPRDGGTGFLLWLREQTLLAQPFDAAKLRLEGDPSPVAEDVSVGSPIRAAFWTSDAGLLVYRAGREDVKARLVWIGRDGKRLGEVGKEERQGSFQLSPDGTRAALTRSDEGDNEDIWVLEFARDAMPRLTLRSETRGNPRMVSGWPSDRILFRPERGSANLPQGCRRRRPGRATYDRHGPQVSDRLEPGTGAICSIRNRTPAFVSTSGRCRSTETGSRSRWPQLR